MRVWVAQVYVGNDEMYDPILVTEEEALQGVVFVECPECEDGVFKITDTDSQPCNFCKGSSLMPVSC